MATSAPGGGLSVSSALSVSSDDTENTASIVAHAHGATTGITDRRQCECCGDLKPPSIRFGLYYGSTTEICKTCSKWFAKKATALNTHHGDVTKAVQRPEDQARLRRCLEFMDPSKCGVGPGNSNNHPGNRRGKPAARRTPTTTRRAAAPPTVPARSRAAASAAITTAASYRAAPPARDVKVYDLSATAMTYEVGQIVFLRFTHPDFVSAVLANTIKHGRNPSLVFRTRDQFGEPGHALDTVALGVVGDMALARVSPAIAGKSNLVVTVEFGQGQSFVATMAQPAAAAAASAHAPAPAPAPALATPVHVSAAPHHPPGTSASTATSDAEEDIAMGGSLEPLPHIIGSEAPSGAGGGAGAGAVPRVGPVTNSVDVFHASAAGGDADARYQVERGWNDGAHPSLKRDMSSEWDLDDGGELALRGPKRQQVIDDLALLELDLGLLDDFDAMPVDTIAKGLTSMSVKKPIVLDALTLLPHKEGASPIVLNQTGAKRIPAAAGSKFRVQAAVKLKPSSKRRVGLLVTTQVGSDKPRVWLPSSTPQQLSAVKDAFHMLNGARPTALSSAVFELGPKEVVRVRTLVAPLSALQACRSLEQLARYPSVLAYQHVVVGPEARPRTQPSPIIGGTAVAIARASAAASGEATTA